MPPKPELTAATEKILEEDRDANHDRKSWGQVWKRIKHMKGRPKLNEVMQWCAWRNHPDNPEEAGDLPRGHVATFPVEVGLTI